MISSTYFTNRTPASSYQRRQHRDYHQHDQGSARQSERHFVDAGVGCACPSQEHKQAKENFLSKYQAKKLRIEPGKYPNGCFYMTPLHVSGHSLHLGGEPDYGYLGPEHFVARDEVWSYYYKYTEDSPDLCFCPKEQTRRILSGDWLRAPTGVTHYKGCHRNWPNGHVPVENLRSLHLGESNEMDITFKDLDKKFRKKYPHVLSPFSEEFLKRVDENDSSALLEKMKSMSKAKQCQSQSQSRLLMADHVWQVKLEVSWNSFWSNSKLTLLSVHEYVKKVLSSLMTITHLIQTVFRNKFQNSLLNSNDANTSTNYYTYNYDSHTVYNNTNVQNTETTREKKKYSRWWIPLLLFLLLFPLCAFWKELPNGESVTFASSQTCCDNVLKEWEMANTIFKSTLLAEVEQKIKMFSQKLKLQFEADIDGFKNDRGVMHDMLLKRITSETTLKFERHYQNLASQLATRAEYQRKSLMAETQKQNIKNVLSIKDMIKKEVLLHSSQNTLDIKGAIMDNVDAITESVIKRMNFINEGITFDHDFLVMLKKEIQSMIRLDISTYDADKTAKHDHALESSGGSVYGIRCTETFVARNGYLTFMGIKLWSLNPSPRMVIQPNVHPGECWPFVGVNGNIILKLAKSIYVTGVTLEHIPKSIAANGTIDSAPKDFTVVGLPDPSRSDGLEFGKFRYEESGTPLQFFAITKSVQDYQFVEFIFHSNWGHPKYTCIYRIRVHGTFQ